MAGSAPVSVVDHACSPAATTRPSRSVRNQGFEPGARAAVPSATAARSRQSVLFRQALAATANAAVSTWANATSAARRTANSPSRSSEAGKAFDRFAPAEIAHRFGRGDLNVGDLVIELWHDPNGEGRIVVAAERAEGVDSHLDVGIGGQSGEHVRDGCRGESSRLGVPAAQGTRRERADVNVLVTEGEKHPRRGGRSPQAAEREDGTPAHRGIGVVHERQEIGDRGVGPESPRLQRRSLAFRVRDRPD